MLPGDGNIISLSRVSSQPPPRMCGKHQIVLVLIDFRQSGSDLESWRNSFDSLNSPRGAETSNLPIVMISSNLSRQISLSLGCNVRLLVMFYFLCLFSSETTGGSDRRLTRTN